MKKNRRAALNLACLVLICAGLGLTISEASIYALLPDRYQADVAYAFVRDVELLCIGLGFFLYLILSPASFFLKAAVHAFVVVQLVSLAFNVALQLELVPDVIATMSIFIVAGCVIAGRNIIAAMSFIPDAHETVTKGTMWQIYHKPTSLMTWALFALDSASGHYSVTDGEDVWYFNRGSGKLVKERLERAWLTNKMSRVLGDASPQARHRLDDMIGTPFTVFTNCSTVLRGIKF